MKTANQTKERKVILSVMMFFLFSIILMGCAQKEEPNHLSKEINTNQGSRDESTILAETVVSDDKIKPSATDAETEIGSLSAEAEEVENIAGKVFVAYFKGDRKAIETYALDADSKTLELYANAGEETPVPDYIIKGAEQVDGKNIDDLCEIWCEFKGTPTDDYLQYLTIAFIKKEDGWKVMWLGVEI